MPNESYDRSVRRERERVNYYREHGWWAARSAGSKSPIDVWAFDPVSGEVILEQIKTKKGSKTWRLKDQKEYKNVKVEFRLVSYDR